MIVAFMTFLSSTVLAGARILSVLAFRAVGEVDSEFLSDGLGIGRDLHLNDDRQLLSFGKWLVGHQ